MSRSRAVAWTHAINLVWQRMTEKSTSTAVLMRRSSLQLKICQKKTWRTIAASIFIAVRPQSRGSKDSSSTRTVQPVLCMAKVATQFLIRWMWTRRKTSTNPRDRKELQVRTPSSRSLGDIHTYNARVPMEGDFFFLLDNIWILTKTTCTCLDCAPHAVGFPVHRKMNDIIL